MAGTLVMFPFRRLPNNTQGNEDRSGAARRRPAARVQLPIMAATSSTDRTRTMRGKM
jgi:hypothetical protein